MTIFECQKDKNMTRVKNKVIISPCPTPSEYIGRSNAIWGWEGVGNR
jgi:hypothetical protein